MGFIRGKERIELARRTIPMVLIRKAFIVLVSSLILILLHCYYSLLLKNIRILICFSKPFRHLGTVGLSRGITPFLTNWGKIIIIIVMYTGRIGIVTLALVVTDKLTAINTGIQIQT
jgi:Trk-type K+ transport system membrane component